MIVAGWIAIVVEADVVEIRVAHIEIRERDLARFPDVIPRGCEAFHEYAIAVDPNFAAIIHVESFEGDSDVPAHGPEAIENLIGMQ